MLAETSVEVLNDERITRAAIYYGLRSATDNLGLATSYGNGTIFVDTSAESKNEYGDVRPDVRFSRWLTAANSNFAAARAGRKVGRFRDAPKWLKFQVDPRDELALGQLFNLNSRAIVDKTGAPDTVLMRVTKKVDQVTHLELEARTTNLGRRYAFIAPAGFPDYSGATAAQRSYAFIASASEVMSDFSDAYRIA